MTLTPKFIEAIVNVLQRTVDDPRVGGRFAALEARLAALESRPLQKWGGVHIQNTLYSEASLVTRAGSLWVATKATTTTPGTSGSDWTLVVKRGSYDT